MRWTRTHDATAREVAPATSLKRDQVWRRDLVGELLDGADRELAEADAEARADRLARLDRDLGARPRGVTLERERARFVEAAAALRWLANAEPLEVARAVRCFAAATKALHRAGIGARGSRLSPLHERIRADLAVVQSRAGGEWRAAWTRASRHPLDAMTVAEPAPLAQALARAGVGGLVSAEPALRLIEVERERVARRPHGEDWPLTVASARILRLSAEWDRSEAALGAIGAIEDADDSVAWERACLHAARAGDLDAPIRALRVGSVAKTPRRLLEVRLWSFGCRAKTWMTQTARTSAMKRVAPGHDGPPSALGLRAAQVLERAYTSSLPLSARVHGVRRLLESLDEGAEVDVELLGLAGCARWLLRAKQPELAQVPLARYAALSLTLSNGATPDAYNLGLPAPDDVTVVARAPVDSAPASSTARVIEMARLGIALLRQGARNLVGEDDATDRLDAYAEVLTHHASVMKGPLMKVGQALSYYGFDVPPDARELLATLQDAADPLDFALVRTVIEGELGCPLERRFRRFDETALAAGSIGQVHAAELSTGESVVVKVQYPNIEANIRHDFRSLRLALPLVGSVLPDWDVRGIVDELATRMLEECDYRHEAAHQTNFANRLANERGLAIPRVFESLSSARVLVTERFDGATFAEFAAQASLAERERASETICRYVVRTTALEGVFNTDLHPGNLLFDGERVCVLDFGNVRAWEGEDGAGWREILESLIHDDETRLERGLRMVGVVDHERVDLRAFHRHLATHLMRVVVEDRAQPIDKTILAREIAQFGPRGPFRPARLQIPPIYVFGFRAYWGMFAILADLGASLNWRRICLRILSETPPAADGHVR